MKRSEPQDRQDKELAEPAKPPIVVRLQSVNNDDSTIGRFAGFDYFRLAVPGVPLRSTPGFMPTPAPRVVNVKKRHSAHAITADIDIAETAKAAEFFLVDGVIVTGVATGQPAEPDEVNSVGRAVCVPTIVGSGITSENLPHYANADAFIVGSSIKKDGIWSNPIDPDRARALVRAFGDDLTK